MINYCFSSDGAEYHIVSDNQAILVNFGSSRDQFKVQINVFSPDNKKYKIIGVSRYYKLFAQEAKIINIIDFDEPSEIKEVPTSLINNCKTAFHIPASAKRIKNDCKPCFYNLNIVSNKENRFISLINHPKIIINNFPLELLCQCIKRRLCIRETIQIIGFMAFYDSNLISIVFPPSVEIICNNAFEYCKNLRSIIFNGNSKLRSIGISAFGHTSIESVEIPNRTVKIGICAFYKCFDLLSLSFQENSKLKKIESLTFSFSKIKSISFPSSVEEIGEKAFYLSDLTFISFPGDSKLKKIGSFAFSETNVSSITFPSSLEEIGDKAFLLTKLSSISFPEDSKLRKIGRCAFFATDLESVVLPSTVGEVLNQVFNFSVNVTRSNSSI